MNNTSPRPSEVSSPARSPLRSSAGPDVTRTSVPISRASRYASVVLPRPGGPDKSTWSSASPRLRAACTYTAMLSAIFRWPTNSAKLRGRSAASSSRSGPAPPGSGDTARPGSGSFSSSCFLRAIA